MSTLCLSVGTGVQLFAALAHSYVQANWLQNVDHALRAPNPLPRPRTSAKSLDYDANLMSSDDASADTDDEWERNIPQTAEIEVYLYLFYFTCGPMSSSIYP